MPRDGNGTYSRTQPDYVFGTIIDETKVNSEFNDIANSLTNSIAADGQTTPTAALKFGGFPLTNIGDAVNRTEAATAAQAQDGDLIYAEDSGAVNAYVITPSPAVTAQKAGRVWRVKINPANTNTGACTLKVNSLSPVAIKTATGSDPAAGSIQGGQIYEFTDTGPGGSYLILTVADIPDGSITTDKLADDAVTNAKMADNAINTVEIVDKAATLAKLADGTQGGLIHYSGAGGAAADSGAGTAGQVWTSGGAAADGGWQDVPTTAPDPLQYQNQLASGTIGPAYNSAAWRAVSLNTEVLDPGGHGSLSGSQIVLAAGTYEIDATVGVGQPASGEATIRARVQNITDAATIIQGVNISTLAGAGDSMAQVSGQFTIATSKNIQIEVFPASQNLAAVKAVTTGSVEVYANVFLRKVA